MWPYITAVLLVIVAVVVFCNRDRIRHSTERRNPNELGRTDPKPDAGKGARRK